MEIDRDVPKYLKSEKVKVPQDLKPFYINFEELYDKK